MAKKEGEEIKTPADDTPPEVEDTPTAEQQTEALQAQLKEATARAEKAESSAQGLRGSLEGKDKKIKEQADLNTRLDGFEETQKILAAMVADRGVSEEEMPEGKKVDYLAKFDEIAKRQKQDRSDAQVKTQQEEYNRQCDAVYAEAKEAFGDDEDALFQVRTFLMNGATDLAEQKIAKAKKSTGTRENKMESEEERINKLVEEKLQVEMGKRNMLESDTGGPSASAGSWDDVRRKFADNPNDPQIRTTYLRMRAERGV